MPDTISHNVAERLGRIEVGMQHLQQMLAPLAAIGESLARIQERSEKHDNSIDALFNKAEAAERRVTEIDAEVNKWVNRGFGAYAVAGVLIGIIASLLFRMVSDYESAIRNNREAIVTIDKRLTQLEFESKARAK